MKKFNLFSVLCALLVAPSFTSCMDDNKNNVTTYQQLQSYFNVYTHVSGARQEMSGNVSYAITYKLSDAKADLTMVGIKLPDGVNLPSISFADLPLTNEGAWLKIKSTTPVPNGSSFQVSFGNLDVEVADRQIGEYYSPATIISYMVGEWYVNSFPQCYITSGNPKVTNGDNVYEPTGEAAPYSLTFDPAKRTCTVSIQGMQFDPKMPAQNMRFKDIPFTAAGNTLTVASADAFTPYTVNGDNTEIPFTRGQISNFRADYSSSNGVKMSFDFTMGETTYKAVINSQYNQN